MVTYVLATLGNKNCPWPILATEIPQCSLFHSRTARTIPDRYNEQRKAKKDDSPLTIQDLDKMPLLHACVRETLRLRPPIMQLMRKARKTFTVTANGREYVIQKGNEVCVSPSVNGMRLVLHFFLSYRPRP